MKYYVFNKPYGVLTQFTSESNKKNLSDYLNISKDCYPIGRLDYDSEGLLIITNDKRLNYDLLNPANKHKREYLLQIEGKITTEAINMLKAGVTINIKGKPYLTKALDALIKNEIQLPERNSPIRFRASIPTSIISMQVIDGKNRQVRKMTASVGYPTLRLIRTKIENLSLYGINQGEYIELSKKVLYNLLNL